MLNAGVCYFSRSISLLLAEHRFFLLSCVFKENIVAVFTLIWHFRVHELVLDSVLFETNKIRDGSGKPRFSKRGLKVLVEDFRKYD